MMTLLKVLTLPIWLPIKILWIASKVIAFCFLIFLLAILIYIAIHIL